MSEADDLARRFFALWAEYLTALLADPAATEPLRRWLAAAASGAAAGEGAGAPSRSPLDAAAAARASGGRDADVVELARRVDELEQRLAAVERAGDETRTALGRSRRRRRTPRP